MAKQNVPYRLKTSIMDRFPPDITVTWERYEPDSPPGRRTKEKGVWFIEIRRGDKTVVLYEIRDGSLPFWVDKKARAKYDAVCRLLGRGKRGKR